MSHKQTTKLFPSHFLESFSNHQSLVTLVVSHKQTTSYLHIFHIPAGSLLFCKLNPEESLCCKRDQDIAKEIQKPYCQHGQGQAGVLPVGSLLTCLFGSLLCAKLGPRRVIVMQKRPKSCKRDPMLQKKPKCCKRDPKGDLPLGSLLQDTSESGKQIATETQMLHNRPKCC